MSTPPSPALPEEHPASDMDTEGSPLRKRSHADMEGQHEDEVSHLTSPSGEQGKFHEQTEENEPDPEAPLEAFDWHEFEKKYHDAMAERKQEEIALFREFERLMAFFQQWASTTSTHEVDRTFHRLRTRMAHVQHSEDELEKKRAHYTSVVEAFERALRLLEG